MLLGAQTLAGKYCLRYSVSSRRISTALYRSSGEDYYTVLGIKPDATLKQIKQAFLDQSKKLHPDIDVSNPELHTQFVRLNEAYSVLSKSSSRREYDSRLRLQRHGAPAATGNAAGSDGDHGDPFFYNNVNPAPRYGYEKSKQQRYWEQFRYPTPEDYADFHSGRKRKRNMKVFGYCVFIMLAGVFIHYVGFRYEKSKQQRYWEQFRYPTPEDYADFHSGRKRKRNMKVFGYCVFIMLAGVFIHYVGFRKLEEFHKSFMADKDRAITEIYNKSKEQARLNGFKKQQEILRQKHAAFMEKYRLKTRGGGNE